MMTQLFHDWPDSLHDNDHVCFVFIRTPLHLHLFILLTNPANRGTAVTSSTAALAEFSGYSRNALVVL